MQQHFIDTSINITMIAEFEPTTGEKTTQTLIHFQKTPGNNSLRGGKTVALSGKKRKTDSRDRA